MPRLCCGCLSRKKRKSFPIHEKQRETEVNKVFIRHVETIRLTPSPSINKKTISKATIKKTSDEQTIKEKNSSPAVSKLFQKSKQLKTPSPLLMTVSDIPEKTVINPSSSWSSSSNSDIPKHQKNAKRHRSCLESYDISKETSTQKKNNSPTKKLSNDMKPPGKSKLVLENVRKMIKDQNIQQQHFHHTQQTESARL